MALTIGEFIAQQQASLDGPDNRYDPKTQSYLELALPEVPFNSSVPSALPPPPDVNLSSPGGLPPPPNVTLGTPGPDNPLVKVPLSVPAPVPDPPPVQLSTPGPDNPLVKVPLSVPAVDPAPPAVQLSAPGKLPRPPEVKFTLPDQLPKPPGVQTSVPAQLPDPPDVTTQPNGAVPAIAIKQEDSGYLPIGRYSAVGGAEPGDLATDPEQYAHALERTARLSPAQVTVHALTQVGLTAMNVFGTVWNPAMVNPPPIGQAAVLPALDLDFDGTEKYQLQIGSLVDEALDGNLQRLESASTNTDGGGVLATLPSSTSLQRIFENAKNFVANAGANRLAARPVNDPLLRTAFAAGIIPMKLKRESQFGFHTFKGGNGGADKVQDDEVYVPLSFCDLRPVGNTYRIVYFRPLITGFSESLAPEWNKQQYMGRVDPVATYQATGRSISLSFKLVAFGPEDVRTIYQKLHWLASMVYPEYDNNLAYKSGPVVRMRVGDVINGVGPEGARGLPGVIDSLEFDYSDKLWELKKGFKVPREIDISLSFTVLHDVPIGRGNEGLFGGLGYIDSSGKYVPTVTDRSSGQQIVEADFSNFRDVGANTDYDYGTLDSVKEDTTPPADQQPPLPPGFSGGN